jgi:hypothetical protein
MREITFTIFNNGYKYAIKACKVEYNEKLIRFSDDKNDMVAYFPLNSIVFSVLADNPELLK